MFLLVPLLAFVLAWVYTAGTNQLALNSWRKSTQEHWTERARILFPIRKSAGLNIWIIPANCALASKLFLSANHAAMVSVFAAAFLGAILGSYGFDRELFPQFTFRAWSRYVAITWAMRVGFWGVFLCSTIFMPSTFGWTTLIVALAVVVFLTSMQMGLGIWFLIRTRVLVPATQRLSEIVNRCSDETGIKCRSLWLLKSPIGYAAALPATGGLIFSEGMLVTHRDSEIASICAHELAHLNESRWTIVLRVLYSIWMVPIILIKPVATQFGAQGVLLLLLPGLLAVVFAKRLGRRMEVRADKAAKAQQQEDGVYACALERLYQINHMPAVMPSDRMVHPHLYDRLLAAGVAPNYPRPPKPQSPYWHSALMFTVLWILVLGAFGRMLHFQNPP